MPSFKKQPLLLAKNRETGKKHALNLALLKIIDYFCP
jgi:hypothetical protein